MSDLSIVLFALASLPLIAQPAAPDLNAARKLLRSGDAAGAGAAAVKLLKESPNSAESHEFAGEVEFRQGEMERAEAEFRKAIQLEPKFGRAWWGLARVFDCSSLYGVARRFFTRAYQFAPDDSDIPWFYGSTLTGAERIAALENSLQRADPATDPKKIERRRDHYRNREKTGWKLLDREVTGRRGLRSSRRLNGRRLRGRLRRSGGGLRKRGGFKLLSETAEIEAGEGSERLLNRRSGPCGRPATCRRSFRRLFY